MSRRQKRTGGGKTNRPSTAPEQASVSARTTPRSERRLPPRRDGESGIPMLQLQSPAKSLQATKRSAEQGWGEKRSSHRSSSSRRSRRRNSLHKADHAAGATARSSGTSKSPGAGFRAIRQLRDESARGGSTTHRERAVKLMRDRVFPHLIGDLSHKTNDLLRAMDSHAGLDRQVNYDGFCRAFKRVVTKEMNNETKNNQVGTPRIAPRHATVGAGILDEDLTRLFEILDHTSTGKVDFNDWCAFVDTLRESNERAGLDVASWAYRIDLARPDLSHVNKSHADHLQGLVPGANIDAYQKSHDISPQRRQGLEEVIAAEARGGLSGLECEARSWGERWVNRDGLKQVLLRSGVRMPKQDFQDLFDSSHVNPHGELNMMHFVEVLGRRKRLRDNKVLVVKLQEDYAKTSKKRAGRGEKEHPATLHPSGPRQKERQKEREAQQLQTISKAIADSCPTRYASMRTMFRAYNTDHSGFLNFKDFWTMIKSASDVAANASGSAAKLVIAPSPKYAFQVFQKLDQNGDGSITYAEFTKTFAGLASTNSLQTSSMNTDPSEWEPNKDPDWRRVRSLLQEKIALLASVDGRMHREPNATVKRVFKELDLNGDGSVSYDEFASAAEKLELKLTAHEVRVACLAIDHDRNGSIEYAELVDAMAEGKDNASLFEVDMNRSMQALQKRINDAQAADAAHILNNANNAQGPEDDDDSSIGGHRVLTSLKNSLTNKNNRRSHAAVQARLLEQTRRNRRRQLVARKMQAVSVTSRSWARWEDRNGTQVTASPARQIAQWMQATHFHLGSHGMKKRHENTTKRRKQSASKHGKIKDHHQMFTVPLSRAENDLSFTSIFADIHRNRSKAQSCQIRPRDSSSEALGLVPTTNAPGHITDSNRLKTMSQIAFSDRSTLHGPAMLDTAPHGWGLDGDEQHRNAREKLRRRAKGARQRKYAKSMKMGIRFKAQARASSDRKRMQAKALQRLRFFEFIKSENQINHRPQGKRQVRCPLLKPAKLATQ